jgi:hypothetical protein
MSSDGDTFVSPSNSFDPDSNKSYSDFDRTHVLNIACDYAFPFGRNQDSDSESSPWVGRILGGWNLGILYVLQSGPRFSVYSGLESRYSDVNNLAGFEGRRPEGTIWRNQGIIYWFNPDEADKFTYPAAGEAGDSGRNYYEGPGYHNLDMVLRKQFNWRESKYVQFRVEGYNLFNFTHFGLPDNTLGSSYFGTIQTTQGSPRSLQVALQLGF